MKSPKSKTIKKELKKKAKSTIELNLGSKIKEFVKSLGHDADEIGDEIKKASKILSKKLTSKIKNVKKIINEKLKTAEAEVKAIKKTSKKDLSKAAKQVKKVVRQTEAAANKAKKTIQNEIAPVVKQISTIEIVSASLKNPDLESTFSSKAVKKPVVRKAVSTTAAKPNPVVVTKTKTVASAKLQKAVALKAPAKPTIKK